MAVDPELLAILVCPKTKGPLELIELPAAVRTRLVDKYREKFRDEEPVVTSGLYSKQAELVYPLVVAGMTLEVSVLSMGNPHAVQVVENVERAPVTTQGPLIENHPAFPQRVNAGYMQIVSREHVRLRVWERGAGETLACGTGACAAVVAGVRRGLLDPEVRVTTHGGDLKIRWLGDTHPVMMTGDAVRVFDGEIGV